MIYRGPRFPAVIWYWLLPSPSRQQCFLFLPVAGRAYWREEPNHTTARKPGLYKNSALYSIRAYGTTLFPSFSGTLGWRARTLRGAPAPCQVPVFRLLLSLVLLITSYDPIRVSYEESGSGCGTGTTVTVPLAVTRSHLQLGGSRPFPSVVSVGSFYAMYISLSFFISLGTDFQPSPFHNSKQ
jgi:hypothetical protein